MKGVARMAKEVCVFCGEEIGYIRSEYVSCGPVCQWACKQCAREIEPLSAVERCRRALQRGVTEARQSMEEYIEMVDGAEEARPACLRCGAKLRFGWTITLDDTPYRDGLLSSGGFAILPAYCQNCGKMELYSPGYISNNKLLSYLVKKDTGEIK